MSKSDGFESHKFRSSRKQSITPQPDPSKCPRCESTNTKFCYYNNYNKSQPRYFCKACKRHWTNGGTLRNVPIGGGRKNKRLRQPIIADPSTMAIRNNASIDQDYPSDPKEPYDGSYEALFVKPIVSERRDDVASYTDIEELKGLISCDFYGSFIGQELAHGDISRLGFLKLSNSFESKPSSNDSSSFIEMLEMNEDSNIATSMIMPSFQETSSSLELNKWNWKDLDTMSLEDMNKPWEDPTFKT